jgi:hypothetical protein
MQLLSLRQLPMMLLWSGTSTGGGRAGCEGVVGWCSICMCVCVLSGMLRGVGWGGVHEEACLCATVCRWLVACCD